MFFYLQQEA